MYLIYCCFKYNRILSCYFMQAMVAIACIVYISHSQSTRSFERRDTVLIQGRDTVFAWTCKITHSYLDTVGINAT